MKWLSKLFTGSVGETADKIAGVVDRFVATPEEKNAMRTELVKVLAADRAQAEETARAELDAKARIIVAELSQGDAYTKRMRPTLGYAGLVAALLEAGASFYFKNQGVMHEMGTLFPAEFWYGWSGMIGLYVWSRSAYDKKGTSLSEKAREILGTKPKKIDLPGLLG